MKTIYKKLLFLFLLLPFSVLAQSTLEGVVLDKATGQPIPGVNINVQGSTNGTSTDFDGKFKLSNLKSGDKVVASYIGYVSSSISYNGQKLVNFSLEEDANQLKEVVVQVGYGSVKKKDATGAVSKVTASKLIQGALVDPIQALQGKAAGVTITKQGGDPNKGFDVKIRGAAGFAAGGSPLYVVDGVRGIDPTTISPEDIVSYDILKDAASTAIYGADGANGVVFITTKRGKEGKTSIEFNTYVAIDNVARKLDLLSAKEYRDYTSLNSKAFTDLGGNTDWQDEILRTGITNNYNFAIGGGSESSSYRASITHTNMEGIIGKSGKERTTGKLNVTQKSFNDKLVVDFGLSGTIENNDFVNYGDDGKSQVLFQAYQRRPTDPVYNPNGSLLEVGGVNSYFNPMHSVNNIQNQRDAKFINGNLGLDLEIAKGLNAKVILSYIREDWEKTYFEPYYRYVFVEGELPSSIYDGYGNREYNNKEQSMIEATLTYKKSFAGVHNLTLLGGYSYRSTGNDGFKAEGNNPISNIIGSDNLLNFENIQLGNITSFKSSRKDIGYFFRAMYDYDSKYYIAGIVRKDGSSVFGANNQWGYFPSVQVAWNVARENFIADNISALNNLKLRASWGISGNSNIPVDAKDLKVSPQATVDAAGNPITNFTYSNNGNPNLKWDKNTELNLGVDFGLFNDKVTGSFEYYNKTISNMLIANTNVPIETNFSNTTFINGGELENKGIEATLNINVIENKDFSWNTTFVYTQNKQHVNALGNAQYNYSYLDVNFITGPGLIGVSTQRMQKGYELGTFYGYEHAGFSSGKWLIKDNKGNTKYLSDATTDDKKVIGHALPKFEMGWSNYLKYKNWDMSLSFRAVYGNDIYNGTNQVFGSPTQIGTRNVNHEALALNDAGVKESASQSSSYFIEDGSFIKLDNVNIGYNFINPTFLKAASKIRFYASVNNVFTLTKYSGVDPEVNFSGGKDNKEIYFGTDQFNIYPKTRTITFGLNLIF
ncbi:SusC/RagA family TonB-linked outer membrane protein [Flavobacterium branchiarum]|uniref:SusC/RagA family TonB-linked outer membrane protein n=1 Tax=Flavobacterium branchiarum TaxID=1114870 RepID=A0ABV5FRP5_9FLAO|nr:SusC/RagA family TonB-linked outer membrane protein [Flavobacterium branchiarum]MDN3671598.1 SusC/RagA family TonB-linked outer membrane protein [Flavobacterium branchiarum]